MVTLYIQGGGKGTSTTKLGPTNNNSFCSHPEECILRTESLGTKGTFSYSTRSNSETAMAAVSSGV